MKIDSEKLGMVFRKLTDAANGMMIDSNYDFEKRAYIISKPDFEKISGYEADNCHYYESHHCGCEHDCCGHLSSIIVEVSCSPECDYVTIITNTQFNY